MSFDSTDGTTDKIDNTFSKTNINLFIGINNYFSIINAV